MTFTSTTGNALEMEIGLTTDMSLYVVPHNTKFGEKVGFQLGQTRIEFDYLGDCDQCWHKVHLIVIPEKVYITLISGDSSDKKQSELPPRHHPHLLRIFNINALTRCPTGI